MRWLTLDRPTRAANAAWLVAGVILAVTGIVAAASHGHAAQIPAYATVAIVLTLAAIAVWRGVRWVTAVVLVGQAGQIFAVAGTIWELTTGVAAGKADEVRGLGFNPTAAVAINLCYSALGFALFCWHVVRRRRLTAPGGV